MTLWSASNIGRAIITRLEYVEQNPGKGPKGDPGGNVMAVGLQTASSAISVPVGTDIVRTSGHTVLGLGSADYIADAAVNSAYVAANPRTSFISSNGRGFRLAYGDIANVTQFGAIGNGSTDDVAACNAAAAWVRANSGTLYFPAKSFYVSDAINFNGCNVRMHPKAVIRGAPGKDVFNYPSPGTVGFIMPNHLVWEFDGFIQVNVTTASVANFNRVGSGGEAIGNCAVAFDWNGTSPLGGTPLSCRLRFNRIEASGSYLANNSSCGVFINVPFYRLIWGSLLIQSLDFGVIQGIPGSKACTFDASADTVALNAHGFANNTRVAFLSDDLESTMPSGILVRSIYFVVNATADTFQIALTSGGAAIDIPSAGAGLFYVSKAGTNFITEYAPDEWTFENWTVSCRRQCVTLCNSEQVSGGLITVHPERGAVRLLNWPSTNRSRGVDGNFQIYSEGPLVAGFPAGGYYHRFEWWRTKISRCQIDLQSADVGGGLILLSGDSCELDVSLVGVNSKIQVIGDQNTVVMSGRSDRDSVINQGSGNTIVYRRRSTGGAESYAPPLLHPTSLPARGGFEPSKYAVNSKGLSLGLDSLFVPGLYTGPSGVSVTTANYDKTNSAPGLPPGCLVLTPAILTTTRFLPYWDGRTDNPLTTDVHVPTGSGAVEIWASASGNCNCPLGVGGSGTSSTPVAAALSTTWQSFLIPYNATNPAQSISPTIGVPDQPFDIRIAAFRFIPDKDVTYTRTIALTGVTYSSLANGGSTTIGSGISRLQNIGGATIASHTVTMPAAPVDGLQVTIGTDFAITALTISPNTGQTVVNAPTTLAAGGKVTFHWRAADSKWRV